jgi:hypothetical protein
MPVRLSLIVLLVLAGFAFAAPAPLPKPESPGVDVVFEAKTKKRADLALLYLQSRSFLEEMLSAEVVRKQLAHLTAEQRRDWLRKRLRVTSNGTLVRLRLDGQTSTLDIVQLVSDRLTGVPYEEDYVERNGNVHRLRHNDPKDREMWEDRLQEYERRVDAVRQLRARDRGRITEEDLREVEAQLGLYEFSARPMTLHRAPRLLRTGR